MKKKILFGLLMGVIILAAEMLIGQIFMQFFPQMAAEYQNPALFRAWSEPLMQLYFLYPFIFALVLVWLWSKTKTVVPGDSAWAKGAKFGLAIWLVASVPGMLISYASFQVSFLMVFSWTLGGLVSLILSGWLLAKFIN